VNRRDADVWATALAALVCAIFVLAVPSTAIRVLFAVPLCFVLPGYGLAMAIFGKRPPRALETLLLTPSLSVVTLVVGAVVLDLTPDGIRVGTWTVLLVVVVLAACGLAVVRRADANLPSRHVRLPRPSGSQAALLVVALVAASASLAWSRVPLPAPNAIGYSQLWMQSVGTPAAPAVRIGLRSGQTHEAAFRLVLIGGSGRPRPVYTRLTLRPGQQTSATVHLLNLPAVNTIVTAELYKLGDPHLYRYVTAVVTSAVTPVVPRPSLLGPAAHHPSAGRHSTTRRLQTGRRPRSSHRRNRP
jgi:hypothetical protein